MNKLNVHARNDCVMRWIIIGMTMIILVLMFFVCDLLTQEPPEPEIQYIEIIEQVPVIEYVEVQKNYYTVSAYEREILAKTVWLESGSQSDECQKAVCSVILNRVARGYGTIDTICHDFNQFSVATYVDKAEPQQHTYDLVDEVIKNGATIPQDVVCFRAKRYHSWATDWKKIDELYFSRLIVKGD